jgi:hypothetical protein
LNAPVPRPRGVPIASIVFGAILVVVAVLVFLGVYVLLPQQEHFNALLWIGVLSLLFSVGAYFAQALTSDPLFTRSLSMGFLALGFVTLFLTVGLAPNTEWGPLSRLLGIIVLLLLLAMAVAAIGWMARSQASEERRMRTRQEWKRSPTLSAFDYASPGAPPTSPPAAVNRPPGGS